jgi:hypothetical protein
MEEKHTVCKYPRNDDTRILKYTLIPDCHFVRIATKNH